MRNGNSLAASYALGNSIGLVVYQIKPDGTLELPWTITDQDGVGTELLTPTNYAMTRRPARRPEAKGANRTTAPSPPIPSSFRR